MDRNREEGAAAVEFALVVTVFLLIVFGIIDFGLALRSSVVVNNAAREGARHGILEPDAEEIEDRVRAVSSELHQGSLTVVVTCESPTAAPCPGGVSGASSGDTIVVNTSYVHDMITPLIGTFGKTLTLAAESRMRVE